MTKKLIGGYNMHDIPVALNGASGDIASGNFLAALGKYRKAAISLQVIPEDEIEDVDRHLALLQKAQYGWAVMLLRVERFWTARDRARIALGDSFKNVPHGSDPRRYVLVQLAEANSDRAFCAVLTHVIVARRVKPHLV